MKYELYNIHICKVHIKQRWYFIQEKFYIHNSKFIQIANKQEKVKTLKDLKNEESENISYYLNGLVSENNFQYNNYKIGDIVFVNKYKYQNGNIGNNHMFLLVDFYKDTNKILYYGMLISSKLKKLAYKSNKIIYKDNKNNLKENSIIKTDVIYKIFTKNILLKIGNIDKTKVDIYKNYLVKNY